jgi:hypothetical protein
VGDVQPSLDTEGSDMVKSSLYGRLITCGRSAASGAVSVAVPQVSAEAAKRLRPHFAMTGCDTNVWPLSPQDWSTG